MSIDWTAFTPWAGTAGGVVLGAAVAVLILANGRIAGISGIVGGLMTPRAGDVGWRLAFVAGLLLSPLVYSAVAGAPPIVIDASFPVVMLAGAVVGVGARYGGGCTSGHGVCGISRLSPRSLVATFSFVATGFATVYVLRHLTGN
jgi:uncharacterized membrane protein YedE/YeeE